MDVLSGKALGSLIEEELKQEAGALRARGVEPTLAVIRVGDDPASEIYVRNKHRAAERVGFSSIDRHLPGATQEELEAIVAGYNADAGVHGILCQFPLPPGLDVRRITHLIDPLKDVDCFHPFNFGLLAMGAPRFLPCTPAGILEILTRHQVPLGGSNVVVIGRSNIVGRPVSLLLSRKGVDATVTLCHTRTVDLPAITNRADVLIVAAGQPESVGADMVKPGAVVVDVGIHRVDAPERERGYRICGDVDYAAVAEKVSAITPVPGGVGPMTIAMLLKNTLLAAKLQAAAG